MADNILLQQIKKLCTAIEALTPAYDLNEDPWNRKFLLLDGKIDDSYLDNNEYFRRYIYTLKNGITTQTWCSSGATTQYEHEDNIEFSFIYPHIRTVASNEMYYLPADKNQLETVFSNPINRVNSTIHNVFLSGTDAIPLGNDSMILKMFVTITYTA